VRDAIGPGKRSAAGTAGGGRWRGTDAPVIADPARPAGQLAARPGRPGRCARRSDRREAAAYVDSGPWRCASLERTGVPQPSQGPVPTAAELRRLAMEPDQLAGEQCLNAEGLVHEHPPISGGRPASRPRCATGAHCDIRLTCIRGDRKGSISGVLCRGPGMPELASCPPIAAGFLASWRAGHRGAQRPRSGAAGALDAVVLERIMPGGGGQGALVGCGLWFSGSSWRPFCAGRSAVAAGGRGQEQPALPRSAGLLGAAPAT